MYCIFVKNNLTMIKNYSLNVTIRVKYLELQKPSKNNLNKRTHRNYIKVHEPCVMKFVYLIYLI